MLATLQLYNAPLLLCETPLAPETVGPHACLSAVQAKGRALFKNSLSAKVLHLDL